MKQKIFEFYNSLLNREKGYEGIIADEGKALFVDEKGHSYLKHLILCGSTSNGNHVLFESKDGTESHEDKMASIVIKNNEKIAINYHNSKLFYAGIKNKNSNGQDDTNGTNENEQNGITIEELSDMIVYFKNNSTSVIFTYDNVNGFNDIYYDIHDAVDPVEVVFQNYFDHLKIKQEDKK